MDWANERYVRVYTRDTGDWLALSYEAQSLLLHLLRKVDRAGVLELGKQGKKTVAVVLAQTALWDRLAPALDELIGDGCVQISGDVLVIPNFVAAQEAPQSDRQRQAESRARRRDMAQMGGLVTRRADVVTNEDAPVTNRDLDVTSGHTASRRVTPSEPSEPSDPNQSDHDRDAVTERDEKPKTLKLVHTEPPAPAFDFEALYRLYPRKEGKQKGLELCEAQIKTAGDYEALRRAILNYTASVEGRDPKYTKHFSSFMRCWKDYVDAKPPSRSGGSAGSSAIPSPTDGIDRHLATLERDARRLGLVDAEGNPT